MDRIYYEVFNNTTGNYDYYVTDTKLSKSTASYTDIGNLISLHFGIIKIATKAWMVGDNGYEIIKMPGLPEWEVINEPPYPDTELTLICLRARELRLYSTYKHNYGIIK